MNKKVVVLGGGTGLPAILRGIKYIEDIDITAIVTIADSGGSTGVLSKHFDIPAVGDLRRVLSALSVERKQLEETMEYRFSGTNTDLDGHTMGNLLLTTHIMMKDDFAEGIRAASKALNVQGTVLPVSNEFNHLNAVLEDGTEVEGEDSIGHSNQPIKKVFYKNGEANEETIESIMQADLIIFGIGSLYTSLIPNLIYPNMIKALEDTKAKIIYFSNVFTQHGETDDMMLSDHVKAIEEHTFPGIIDEVIYSSTKISDEVLKTYEDDDQFLVVNDYPKAKEFDLTDELHMEDETRVWHEEEKIKKCVEQLI